MKFFYLAQEGIWSPRDKLYIWRDVEAFDYQVDAVKSRDSRAAWRVLRIEVVNEHAPKLGIDTEKNGTEFETPGS